MSRKSFLKYISVLLFIILFAGIFISYDGELTLDEVIDDTGYHFSPRYAVIYNWDTYPATYYENGQYRYGLANIGKYSFHLPYAIGDLDADGDDDYAVLFFHYNGGSGQWIDLTTVMNENGKPVQYGLAGIGDRTGVTDMRIDDGVIYIVAVDYRTAYEYQYTYILVGEELVETLVSKEMIGYERLMEY